MPKRHMWNRFIRDFKEFTLKQMDYCHYTVPLQVTNQNGFVFPGDYVGQYGVYEAVKHVYNSSSNLKHLIKDDHLLTNTRYFSSDMENAILKIRSKFRQEHNIDEKAFSIFIAPGNEQAEVEFTMEQLRRGVKEFLLKYSSPTSLSPQAAPLETGFVTILSLHAGSPGEKWVREYLQKNEWKGKLIIVTDENNVHYNAMAASDFGFIHDGQMVSSANALHLPVNCMFDMRMNQQFYQDFFNRWWNDMNLLADQPINPELIGGQCWWGKICDTLAESYIKPQERFRTI